MELKTSRVRVNMLMNAVLTAASIVFPIATLPYVSRILGVGYLGKVYFSSSVVMVFSMIAELGIPIYGIKACAAVRDDKTELSRTVHEIVFLNVLSSFVSYVLLAIAVLLIPKVIQERTLIILMSSSILLNSIGVEWLYKALEKYTYITVRSLVFKTAAFLAVFLFVKDGRDYILYGVLTIGAAMASNILNLVNLKKYVEIRFIGDYDIRKHIPELILLFLMAAAVNIYTNMDVALLDMISGDAEAGAYGVAVRIKMALVSLTTAVSAVLLPRNSYYYGKGDRKSFISLINRTLRLVVIITFAFSGFFIVYAKEAISLLTGKGFESAIIPLMILMLALPIISLSNVVGMQMLVPVNKGKAVTAAALLGAIVDLVLNIILIPIIASTGAAISTLAAEVSVLAYLMRTVGLAGIKELMEGFSLLRFLSLLLPAMALGICIKNLDLPEALRIVVGAICYFSVFVAGILVYKKKNDLLY